VIGRDFIGRASPSEQGPLWVACPSLPPPSPPCASPPGQLAEVGQGCPEAGRAAPRLAEAAPGVLWRRPSLLVAVVADAWREEPPWLAHRRRR
jgi:hypothetical protein